ncbi:MAG: YfhO family protein [Acidobacteria bacterium]|nr:YfhO family protein [Acidobacteriota bacterium]
MKLGRAVRREALFVVAASIALVAFACLLPPTFFEGTDWLRLHLPNKIHATESLRGGELPLWNPYASLGRPFLADTETAVLYPPNLLYLATDPSSGLLLLTLAHFILGLVGMLALGRALGMERWASWLAGACFLWSAPLVARLSAGQVPYAHATCYVPLLFYLALRLQDRFSLARLTALAATLALQLVCGHPQIAWVTWLGLGSFLLGRALPPTRRPLVAVARGVGGLALALLAAFALSSPMLLPFLELASEGNRSAPSVTFAAGGALEWWQWTSLALPDGGRRVFSWEVNLYAGILPVVAGLAGLLRVRDGNVRGLLLASLAGALVAAGTRTPAFVLLYHLVPGLSSFHIHSRAALLVVFALILGAGLFLSRADPPRRVAASLGAGVALAVVAPLLFRFAAPVPDAAAEPFPLTRLALAGLVAVLAAGTLLRAPGRGRLGARVALAVVVLTELGVTTGAARRAWHFPVSTANERPVFEALVEAGLYESNGVPPRIALPPWIVRQNAGLLYKWADIAGYNALTLSRVWIYLHETLGLTPPLDENTYPSRHLYDHGPFPYDSMSIVAGWKMEWQRSGPGSEVGGWQPPPGRLVLRDSTDPRAYLLTAVRPVSHWREAVTAMTAGHDFHRVALVETETGLASSAESLGEDDAARVEIVSFRPEHVVLETESAAPALLVLAEAWYPGWTATVDGAPAPCLPANAWMRAVPVPAGAHRVEMRFHSRWLGPGALVALLTAATLGVLVRRERRRRPTAARS